MRYHGTTYYREYFEQVLRTRKFSRGGISYYERNETSDDLNFKERVRILKRAQTAIIVANRDTRNTHFVRNVQRWKVRHLFV